MQQPHGTGAGPDEREELDALRKRAYGPDADIADDPDALARLQHLEAALRTERGAGAGSASTATHLEPSASSPSSPTGDHATASSASDFAPRRSRAPRWHAGLVASTAIAALLLSGVAWTHATASTETVAETPVVADQRWSTSSAAGYREFLDHLRDLILSRDGLEGLSERIIKEDLRPYGSLFGHKVWAGSTIDGEYCMIIDGSPAAQSGCISVDDAYASPLTIVLPRGEAESAAEAELEPGEPISYTLLPGGTVVAEPSGAWSFTLD